MVAVFSSELINIPENLTTGSCELVGTSPPENFWPSPSRRLCAPWSPFVLASRKEKQVSDLSLL